MRGRAAILFSLVHLVPSIAFAQSKNVAVPADAGARNAGTSGAGSNAGSNGAGSNAGSNDESSDTQAGPSTGPTTSPSSSSASSSTPAGPASSAPSVPPPPSEPPSEDKPALDPFGGRVFTYARVPITGNPGADPLQQVSSSVWLEGSARMYQSTYAKFILTTDALTPSLAGTSEVRGRIREAYVGIKKSGWDFRIGQQILPWGNADGVTAIDLLASSDFSFFTVDGEARRLGTPMAKLSATPNGGDSPFQFTVVWIPAFTSSVLLIPANTLPPGITVQPVTHPKFSLDNSEAAAKITYADSGFDLSLIGFRGFNHLPDLTLEKLDATGVTIGQRHHPYIAAGGESSYTVNKWVFRLEGAHVWTENTDLGTEKLVEPSHVTGIVGIERPLGDRVRFGIQGFVRYYPQFKKPNFTGTSAEVAALQAISRTNSIIHNYTDVMRSAGTLRIAYSNEDETFEAEAFALFYFVGGDYVIRPLLGYRFTDALKGQIGLEYYGGADAKTLGALNSYSGAFLQATYTF